MNRLFPLMSLTLVLAGAAADPVDTAQQGDKELGDKEQQFYLKQIFHKYGNGGVITFEIPKTISTKPVISSSQEDKNAEIVTNGLEHLMESLGLGKIKFEKSHNVSVHKTENGDFEDLHDSRQLHNHEHSTIKEETRRKRAVETKENSCLRPKELLKLYGLETGHGVRILPERFLQICPAIISQLDSRVCAVPLHKHDSHSTALPVTSISRELLWAYGLGSIVIVSLCGIIGFAFFPLLGKSKCQTLCSLLSSLSIGTLAGDALLHLIPHTLHDLSDETDGLLKLSFIFLVMMALFIYESFIHLRETNKMSSIKSEMNGTELGPVQHDIGGHGHSHHAGSIVQMVLGGDFLHNLTDGLAIGAAYGQHPITGFATTIAVLLHEVPHELGDLAILLDSGVSVKKALVFNILSSIFSLFGAVVGLIVGEVEAYAEWVYAFTAGSFLYIALATLMPDMFKKTKTVGRLLTHTAGIFSGGVIMFFIAMYEHQLRDMIEDFAF